MSNMWPACEGDIHYISPPPPDTWIKERRSLVILGSTGSIGVNALRSIEKSPGHFQILALAGARNVQLLAEQAARWRPAYIGVFDAASRDLVRKLLPRHYKPQLLCGAQGYAELARLEEANTVLSAQVGAAGLRGTVAAALAGKVICLANKESLVLAGDLIRRICAHTKASILPVDSEHNALFQLLAGREAQHVKKLILTASGGPFQHLSFKELQSVTKEQALKHPNWSMGAKITIDSASLMNKGLELIEAYHLYNIHPERLGVLVHPQSIIHSLVEFADNSVLAHMGAPDMRMPLAHCLLWPHMEDVGVSPLDLLKIASLTFTEPDTTRFPCLALAQQALSHDTALHTHDATQCVVLNAANEEAVDLFLQGRIAFMDIPTLIDMTMKHFKHLNNATPQHKAQSTAEAYDVTVEHCVQEILECDNAARKKLRTLAAVPEVS